MLIANSARDLVQRGFHAGASPAQWQVAARERLLPLLESGAPQGIREQLERLAAAHGEILDLQLEDADGVLLAAWPARITANRWGLLARPASSLRQTLIQVLGRSHSLAISRGQRTYGRLQASAAPLPALGWAGLGALATLVLGLAGLLGVLRGAVTPPQSRTSPRPPRGTPEVQVAPRWHFRPAFQALSHGVMLTDARLQLRFVNPAAEKLTAWPRERALNTPLFSVLRLVDDKGEALKLELEPLLHGRKASLETTGMLVPREGGRRPVRVSVLALAQPGQSEQGLALMLTDGTVDMAEREDLRREADLAIAIFEQLGEGVLITDRLGRIQRANPRLLRMFAYPHGELGGVAISKLLPVPFLNEPSITLRDYVGHPNEKTPRVVGWRKDATTFPVELEVQELRDPNHAYLVLVRDRGAKQRQENLLMRLGRLLDYAAEEIYVFDAHSLYVTEANREAREALGYSVEQFSRMTLLHLAPDLNRSQFDDDMAALRAGDKRQVVYRTEHRRANGSRYPVSLRISFSRDEEPPVFIALAQDISEQRAAEARLEHLAHNDALTGLPNRTALMERLPQLLEGRKHGRRVMVWYLDVDRFKSINDSRGHAAGDAALRGLADRLLGHIPEDHMAARLSGDEFCVAALIEPDVDPRIGARRVLNALARPLPTDDGELRFTVSIGIALDSGDEATPERLLRRADQAMYHVKARGGADLEVA